MIRPEIDPTKRNNNHVSNALPHSSGPERVAVIRRDNVRGTIRPMSSAAVMPPAIPWSMAVMLFSNRAKASIPPARAPPTRKKPI